MRPGGGQRLVVGLHEARDAEVDEVHGAGILDQDVCRLHVAVHDPRPVCDAERVRDRTGDRPGLLRLERSIRRDALLKRAAGSEVHHERRIVRVVDDLARPDDRRVVERPERGRLSLEAGPRGRIGHQERVESLECHDLAGSLVERTPERRHPPDGMTLQRAISPVDQSVAHPTQSTTIGVSASAPGPRVGLQSRVRAAARAPRRRLRLQVEGADVARAKHRDGSTIERGDPADSQPLRRRDHERVDEPGTVFLGGLDQLGGSGQVGFGR